MKSVLVYVEGVSDRVAMEALFYRLIEKRAQEGISIRFQEAQQSNPKTFLMETAPQRAALILANDPHSVVIVIPDLYPPTSAIETPEKLLDFIRSRFERALHSRNLSGDRRYNDRFHVFCFKYDLEALVLAAEEALKVRLNSNSFRVSWARPVEDQNHIRHPKQIVQELFEQHGTRYQEVADAQLIMALSDYRQIAEACPQQFKPFVDFLETLKP